MPTPPELDSVNLLVYLLIFLCRHGRQIRIDKIVRMIRLYSHFILCVPVFVSFYNLQLVVYFIFNVQSLHKFNLALIIFQLILKLFGMQMRQFE